MTHPQPIASVPSPEATAAVLAAFADPLGRNAPPLRHVAASREPGRHASREPGGRGAAGAGTLRQPREERVKAGSAAASDTQAPPPDFTLGDCHLRLLFESLRTFACLIDGDGAIVHISQTAAEFAGSAAAAAIGLPMWDLPCLEGRPEAAASLRAALSTLPSSGPVRFEAELLRSDGEARIYDVSLRRMQAARGGPALVLAEGVDVTDLKRLEQEVRHASKMAAIGQLTSGIAHDINNVLQGIGGAVELCQTRIGRQRLPEAESLLSEARQGVSRAASLTGRLLSFGHLKPARSRSIRPESLIMGIWDLILRTTGAQVSAHLRIGDAIRPVRCDSDQLESALLNLAINARDAMPDGGALTVGIINCRLSSADVDGWGEAMAGDYVEVSVGDTGSGMDQDTRTRAFDAFFTTKPAGKGTGLGLFQLDRFARQSCGVVRLDSEVGQGTVVRLYLPATSAEAAA